MSDSRPTMVVTGANRGLGLALVQRGLRSGYRVVALAREPDDSCFSTLSPARRDFCIVIRCDDIADANSVRQAVADTSEHCNAVELLINNAGVNRTTVMKQIACDIGGDNPPLDTSGTSVPCKRELMRSFAVNAVGPLLTTYLYLGLLLNSSRPKVVNITSDRGSLRRTPGQGGGNYAYRMSKAALNMATAAIAEELRHTGLVVTAVEPGWFRSRIGGPDAPLTTEVAADNILRVASTLDESQSGRLIDAMGRSQPW